MTRPSARHSRGLVFESLEARINPDAFLARTDSGPVLWSNPLAWSDDPASTAIPGPGDTVTVEQGEWDIDLGGAEVVIDRLITQGQGKVAPHLIILRHGVLRFTESSVLSNAYSADYSADPVNLVLVDSRLVAGAGPTGAPGQIVSE